MRWRPHAEPAPAGTIALIAIRGDDGTPFVLPDFYEAAAVGWRDENTGHLLRHVDHYWLPEQELLAPLRALAS